MVTRIHAGPAKLQPGNHACQVAFAPSALTAKQEIILPVRSTVARVIQPWTQLTGISHVTPSLMVANQPFRVVLLVEVLKSGICRNVCTKTTYVSTSTSVKFNRENR